MRDLWRWLRRPAPEPPSGREEAVRRERAYQTASAAARERERLATELARLDAALRDATRRRQQQQERGRRWWKR